MAETPQSRGVETPKDTHGLNPQIPKKHAETPDSDKLNTLKQNATYEKEVNVNGLTVILRTDAQKLSAELNIPLDRWSKIYRPLTGQGTLQMALEEKPQDTQSRESSLSNQEWQKTSRKNIERRLALSLEMSNPSLVVSILSSLPDYRNMAQGKWMDEQSFVEEMISRAAKSDLKEAVLGVMRLSLEEIKQVRTTVQRLDTEMKSKPAGSQIRLQDLNPNDVLFIEKSSLAGLFVLNSADTPLDQDFFSEKTGTPQGRLPWLQVMYDQMIQSMEETNQK